MQIAETRPETIQEYQKSQNIRLLDVFLIGPVMIYAGTHKQLAPWLRFSLIVFGASTIYYNAKNYMVNYRNEQSTVKKN